MALTDNLRRIYSTAPANELFYEAVALTHPAWTDNIALITNTIVPKTKNLGALQVTFNPAPFRITLPRRNDGGLVDLNLTFPLASRMMLELLQQAERAREPITALVTVYVDSSDDPQITPIELQMDSIVMTDTEVSGNASRLDLINRAFPRRIVRPEEWPGLYR